MTSSWHDIKTYSMHDLSLFTIYLLKSYKVNYVKHKLIFYSSCFLKKFLTLPNHNLHRQCERCLLT